ncbi:MAG: hypothetical protein WC314_21355 [Vulcanimicrobiota bacterium]
MAFINSSFNLQTNFQAGFSPGVPSFGGFGGAPVGAQAGFNPIQVQALLQQLMSAIQQLASGYQGFGGQPGFNPGMPFGGGGGFPSFPQPQFPGQNPFQFYPSPGTPYFGGQPGFPSPYPGPGFPQPGYPSQPNFPTQPGGPGTPGNPVSTGPGVNTNLDYTKLNKAERGNLTGLNDTGRAVLHLWGIQVTSEGKNNGGIYFNVLNNPDNFQPAEVELVRNLYNQEMAMFGGVTGKLLDQHFFGVYKDMTGKDVSQRYGNRPLEFAQGPVNMDNRLTGNNGLSSFDNTVIRLWGHDTLDNGVMDGSVTEYTLGSQFALDKVDGSNGSINRREVEILLAADLADGRRDGNALEDSFIDSLDRIYFGGPGANAQTTANRAGLNASGVDAIIAQWQQNPPPGIPPGVDITNTQNIGKCPVLGPMVTQQGGAGGIQFGGY